MKIGHMLPPSAASAVPHCWLFLMAVSLVPLGWLLLVLEHKPAKGIMVILMFLRFT